MLRTQTQSLPAFLKYGTLNSWDLIKFTALCLMFIDHMGFYLFTEHNYIRAIGRSSMPLFMFLIGYSNCRTINGELALIAVLTQFLSFLVEGTFLPLNILFTIMLARILLYYVDRSNYLKRHVLQLFLLTALTQPFTLILEYAGDGLLFVLVGYVNRNKLSTKSVSILLLAFSVFFHIIVSQVIFMFSGYSFIAMFVCLCLVARMMANFELKKENLAYVLACPVMFFSRNALSIYFLHQVALVMLSMVLNAI